MSGGLRLWPRFQTLASAEALPERENEDQNTDSQELGFHLFIFQPPVQLQVFPICRAQLPLYRVYNSTLQLLQYILRIFHYSPFVSWVILSRCPQVLGLRDQLAHQALGFGDGPLVIRRRTPPLGRRSR